MLRGRVSGYVRVRESVRMSYNVGPRAHAYVVILIESKNSVNVDAVPYFVADGMVTSLSSSNRGMSRSLPQRESNQTEANISSLASQLR